jgi:hypothetical protein
MAKKIYESGTVHLLDGTEIILGPLKIKYMREFMDIFNLVKLTTTDEQSITVLSECATVCMRQYYPLIQTRDQLEDALDLPTVYKTLEYCAGIKINGEKEDIDKQAKEENENNTWENLDLASLESEVFLVGAWKNFEELEYSISMSELVAIIEKMRDLDYNEKKFLAAMQGVDLDKENNQGGNAWEKMKAKVFSGGETSNPNDILALQGQNATRAGFGIGMGLSYEKIERKKD